MNKIMRYSVKKISENDFDSMKKKIIDFMKKYNLRGMEIIFPYTGEEPEPVGKE